MGKETIQVVVKGEGTFSLEKGESVLSVLKDEKIAEISNCGGNGTCQKCVVRFIKGAPLPGPGDRKKFDASQLRDGYRLACLAKPVQDCILELCIEEKKEFILTESSIMKVDVIPMEETAENYGDTMITVDLGTTSIVLQLVEIERGIIIDTYQALNPQRRYGADVISRMQHALTGNGRLLSEKVMNCIQNGMARWTMAGFAPKLAVIAGNTVMAHLLMEYDVQGLSKAPFAPVTLEPVSTQIGDVPAIIMPGISAFVGGDIVSGIMACQKKMASTGVKYALLLDLGTNGELALIGPDKILCTATSAGPAFEGGATVNVPGSDMIDITARLLSKNIVDDTGLIGEEYFHQGITVDGVMIRQEDIRGLQIAKAAIFAGIRLLLKEYGIAREEVEQIYLAGGFGYKLNVEAACRIGLIPGSMKERTIAVGNTALAGAFLYGKRHIQDNIPNPAEEIIRIADSMNLAECDEFNGIYVHAMDLREEG